jgi:O-methyltransferase involved in polyketide biosynthesis
MPPEGKHTDNDEQRWRALAQEARQQASLMTDPDARRIMRSIADGYERLAERAKLKRNESNPD